MRGNDTIRGRPVRRSGQAVRRVELVAGGELRGGGGVVHPVVQPGVTPNLPTPSQNRLGRASSLPLLNCGKHC